MAGGVRRATRLSSDRRSSPPKGGRSGTPTTPPNGSARADTKASHADTKVIAQAGADSSTNADAALQLINDVRLRGPLDNQVLSELGRMIRVLPDVGLIQDPRVVGQVSHVLAEASLAFEALLARPPNLEFGQMLRKDVCWRVHPLNVIIARFLFPGESPATWLAFGLAIFGILGVPAVALGYRFLVGWQPLRLTGVDANTLVVVAIAGGLGAIVSIATRIVKATEKKNARPNNMFWTGLFKPFIGTIFAVFVYTLLNSGLVPVSTIDPKKQVFFFAAIGFIAGFSERFAPDLANAGSKQLQPKS